MSKQQPEIEVALCPLCRDTTCRRVETSQRWMCDPDDPRGQADASSLAEWDEGLRELQACQARRQRA